MGHPRHQHLHPWVPSKCWKVAQLRKELEIYSRNQCMVHWGLRVSQMDLGSNLFHLYEQNTQRLKALFSIVCKSEDDEAFENNMFVCRRVVLSCLQTRWTVAGCRTRPPGFPLVTSAHWSYSSYLDYRKDYTSPEEKRGCQVLTYCVTVISEALSEVLSWPCYLAMQDGCLT